MCLSSIYNVDIKTFGGGLDGVRFCTMEAYKRIKSFRILVALNIYKCKVFPPIDEYSNIQLSYTSKFKIFAHDFLIKNDCNISSYSSERESIRRAAIEFVAQGM